MLGSIVAFKFRLPIYAYIFIYIYVLCVVVFWKMSEQFNQKVLEALDKLAGVGKENAVSILQVTEHLGENVENMNKVDGD